MPRDMATPLHLKPPVAAWLIRERRRLGLKPRDIADRLRAQGLDVTEATIKVWESNADRRPNPYNLEGLEKIFGSKAPEPRQPAEAATGALVEALRAQTQAIADLVLRLDDRLVGAAAVKVTSDDEATIRRRRRYWIERAIDEAGLKRPDLRAAVGLPAGREKTLTRWIQGDLPKGRELERLAQVLMLPMSVLEDPPPTDLERLVEWRRESVSELPAAELEERPARQRRSA